MQIYSAQKALQQGTVSPRQRIYVADKLNDDEPVQPT